MATVPGRSVGHAPLPRFDRSKLRPYEVMFADNKDYPELQRGKIKTGFVLTCYKTDAMHVVNLTTKSKNGEAFERMHSGRDRHAQI